MKLPSTQRGLDEEEAADYTLPEIYLALVHRASHGAGHFNGIQTVKLVSPQPKAITILALLTSGVATCSRALPSPGHISAVGTGVFRVDVEIMPRYRFMYGYVLHYYGPTSVPFSYIRFNWGGMWRTGRDGQLQSDVTDYLSARRTFEKMFNYTGLLFQTFRCSIIVGQFVRSSYVAVKVE
jgi:hypothetical protein